MTTQRRHLNQLRIKLIIGTSVVIWKWLVCWWECKEGIFIGLQIKSVLQDERYKQTLSTAEFEAWVAFKWLCENFLGTHKSPGYKEGVQHLLDSYQKLGRRMSLKIHILHSQFQFFPENVGMVSDEQGERFRQDIQLIERHYQGFRNCSMMADYCWMLYHNNPDTVYTRKIIC